MAVDALEKFNGTKYTHGSIANIICKYKEGNINMAVLLILSVSIGNEVYAWQYCQYNL